MTITPNKYKPSLCELVAERNPVERIIRISEMLILLNISRVTLYRWSKKGLFIKPIQYNGRTIGWKKSNYDEWLNNKNLTLQQNETPK